jgi:hypothetical protein
MTLTKGGTYRFRYRAANAISWGGWSPISEVQAAREPEAPPAPTITSSSTTAITL